MKYKITITEIKVEEYPDILNIWIDANGDETTNYNCRVKTVNKPSGKILTRDNERIVYTQESDDMILLDVIKAVNGILK